MEVGMPLEQFLITMAAIIGTVVALRGPIGRALAARIEGRRAPDHETQMELEDLRARVAALEEGHAQLAELQERIEFAERLLAAKRERRPELPG
jgi:Tfp pilus assembly protein PilO